MVTRVAGLGGWSHDDRPPMTTHDKTVIFHLGAQATGNWVLQRYLREHNAQLGGRRVHVAPQQDVSSAAGWGRLASDPARFAKVIQRGLHGTECDVLVASYDDGIGEPFGDGGPGLYPDALPALQGFATAAEGYRVVVVLTVRPQDQFLEGYYIRRINAGGFDPFATWLAGVDLERLSWSPLHSSLVDTFGAQAVRVLDCRHPGLREAIDPGAFFRLVDLDPPTRTDGSPLLGRGISERALDVALAANPYLTSYPERSNMRRFLQTNFPDTEYLPPVLLGDAQRAALQERYGAEYEALVAPGAGAGASGAEGDAR